MITSLVSALIVGSVEGVLGRLVLPGRQELSVALTMLVGVMAALIGSAATRALGLTTPTGSLNWVEIAIQGALAAGGVSLLAGGRGP